MNKPFKLLMMTSRRFYIYWLWVLPIVMALAGCNDTVESKLVEKPNADSQVSADSVALTKLIRNLYGWHEAKHLANGFPLKVSDSPNKLFTGVDWGAYEKDVQGFTNTGFFSQEFLKMHRAIAITIDSSVKKASAEWRNPNDGVPLWSNDSDDFCGCQDNPDNYWTRLEVNNLKFINGKAFFNWTWDMKDNVDPPFTYEMAASKENGVWKISSMEGFKNYGIVADYDKMMNRSKQ